jgi:hypothetical protein
MTIDTQEDATGYLLCLGFKWGRFLTNFFVGADPHPSQPRQQPFEALD